MPLHGLRWVTLWDHARSRAHGVIKTVETRGANSLDQQAASHTPDTAARFVREAGAEESRQVTEDKKNERIRVSSLSHGNGSLPPTRAPHVRMNSKDRVLLSRLADAIAVLAGDTAQERGGSAEIKGGRKGG